MAYDNLCRCGHMIGGHRFVVSPGWDQAMSGRFTECLAENCGCVLYRDTDASEERKAT